MLKVAGAAGLARLAGITGYRLSFHGNGKCQEDSRQQQRQFDDLVYKNTCLDKSYNYS